MPPSIDELQRAVLRLARDRCRAARSPGGPSAGTRRPGPRRSAPLEALEARSAVAGRVSTDAHARDGQRGGARSAQEHRLPEREVVGWKKPSCPSGSSPLLKRLQHRLLDVAAEEPGLHADVQLDLERHGDRAVDLEVVAGQPEALEERREIALELVVDRPARPAGRRR